jgi:RNA polymerase sigma factor (sigma-70 family)
VSELSSRRLGSEVLHLTPERLRELLNGERGSAAPLIEALWPHVRIRVARVARRAGLSPDQRSQGPDLDDLCQEAFLELFGNDARTLRGWDPERGLSLPSFVQLVAERTALSRIKRWKRSHTLGASLDNVEDECAADSVDRPDRRVASRKRFERVLDELSQELSPRGLELFRALFVEGQQTARVCQDFALRPDAVYAWRSRLSKRIKTILEGLEPHSETQRTPKSQST